MAREIPNFYNKTTNTLTFKWKWMLTFNTVEANVKECSLPIDIFNCDREELDLAERTQRRRDHCAPTMKL